MEENNILPCEESTVQVVDIQFRPGQKIYYFDPNGITCKLGDHVIIDTARGPEFGICAGGNHCIGSKEVVSPLRPVIRHATAHDEKVLAENREKEKQAFDACIDMIRRQQLDMQLVSAEYAFDGSKILFFFTADERVDFRELVKCLASTFHTRIELRQIGVRDKAKMVGGLGICGRPFCCASFLDDFQPVSIKMAKTQNLSLNPAKISGTCGRLMCCLKYEQDVYEDLIRTSPKAESFVDTPDGRGTVIELDLLRQRVKVRFEERPEATGTFSNEEIAVLRNGKAKKTDPPIPADLAPISGSGKRRKLSMGDDAPILDAIKLRYSEDTIAEEHTESTGEETQVDAPLQQQAELNRSRRRRRGRGGNPHKDTSPKEVVQHKEQAADSKPQSNTASKEDAPQKRRRHYRRRRAKGNSTSQQQ